MSRQADNYLGHEVIIKEYYRVLLWTYNKTVLTAQTLARRDNIAVNRGRVERRGDAAAPQGLD
jgi:hypothetical protein